MWRECCDICEGYCVAKGDNTKVVSILHTPELYIYSLLFCFRLCLISYFSEMFSDIQYICASPLLSGDFAWSWCVESPICMRLGCRERAAVALAAEMFSFF